AKPTGISFSFTHLKAETTDNPVSSAQARRSLITDNLLQPMAVEIHEGELPKSGTGKIQKKELREPHWQGHNRRVN
ncbi:MAG: hypothetical protein ACRD82_10180, partial [Blastocatellia bacterium]